MKNNFLIWEILQFADPFFRNYFKSFILLSYTIFLNINFPLPDKNLTSNSFFLSPNLHWFLLFLFLIFFATLFCGVFIFWQIIFRVLYFFARLSCPHKNVRCRIVQRSNLLVSIVIFVQFVFGSNITNKRNFYDISVTEIFVSSAVFILITSWNIKANPATSSNIKLFRF